MVGRKLISSVEGTKTHLKSLWTVHGAFVNHLKIWKLIYVSSCRSKIDFVWLVGRQLFNVTF